MTPCVLQLNSPFNVKLSFVFDLLTVKSSRILQMFVEQGQMVYLQGEVKLVAEA